VFVFLKRHPTTMSRPLNVPWRNAAALAVCIAVTFLAPALGAWAMPGEWYATLRKPSWNPPSWIFGPVWTSLYVMMATAAWLVWRRGGWAGQRRALSLYLEQLALNAAWTPIFFGLKMPGLAFAEILLLFGAVLATAIAFRRVSKGAALLVPYIAWVSFASFLNYTLWSLNP
jgi:translocator protein